MESDVRILLLADTHLGFDLPIRPRVERRRRGHDFLANYDAALAPALAGEVDLVVHGGDVFDRSSVVSTLAYQAFEPLRRVADRGIPVFIVPGNHERSRLPHLRFAVHPLIHVFDRPRTVVAEVRGERIAITGLPYERRGVRASFPALLEESRWRQAAAERRILCLHHCVEGATVGPANYTFTTAEDVIRLRDVPPSFSAVLSGHIHRHQVLTADLHGRAIPAPVLYPGSIERTSFAEMDEPKGYIVLTLGNRMDWEFRRLPARPMFRWELNAETMSAEVLDAELHAAVARTPSDAVVSLRITGNLTPEQWRCLAAGRLRTLVPETMNVDLAPAGRVALPRAGRPPAPRESGDQLDLL